MAMQQQEGTNPNQTVSVDAIGIIGDFRRDKIQGAPITLTVDYIQHVTRHGYLWEDDLMRTASRLCHLAAVRQHNLHIHPDIVAVEGGRPLRARRYTLRPEPEDFVFQHATGNSPYFIVHVNHHWALLHVDHLLRDMEVFETHQGTISLSDYAFIGQLIVDKWFPDNHIEVIARQPSRRIAARRPEGNHYQLRHRTLPSDHGDSNAAVISKLIDILTQQAGNRQPFAASNVEDDGNGSTRKKVAAFLCRGLYSLRHEVSFFNSPEDSVEPWEKIRALCHVHYKIAFDTPSRFNSLVFESDTCVCRLTFHTKPGICGVLVCPHCSFRMHLGCYYQHVRQRETNPNSRAQPLECWCCHMTLETVVVCKWRVDEYSSTRQLESVDTVDIPNPQEDTSRLLTAQNRYDLFHTRLAQDLAVPVAQLTLQENQTEWARPRPPNSPVQDYVNLARPRPPDSPNSNGQNRDYANCPDSPPRPQARAPPPPDEGRFQDG